MSTLSNDTIEVKVVYHYVEVDTCVQAISVWVNQKEVARYRDAYSEKGSQSASAFIIGLCALLKESHELKVSQEDRFDFAKFWASTPPPPFPVLEVDTVAEDASLT